MALDEAVFDRTCDTDGCDRPHYARGMCRRHYQRWRVPSNGPRQRITVAPGWSVDIVALAYAAGLFEGEGSAHCTQQYQMSRDGSKRYTSGVNRRASIGMYDLEPLERFCAAVGVGHINGPYNYDGRARPMYTWAATGVEAVQHVACLLWRWLSPRRREQFAWALRGAPRPEGHRRHGFRVAGTLAEQGKPRGS